MALSLFRGSLAAAGESLALRLILPVQREVVVLLHGASSLAQPQVPACSLLHPAAARKKNGSKAESPWMRAGDVEGAVLSAAGVGKVPLADSAANLPV